MDAHNKTESNTDARTDREPLYTVDALAAYLDGSRNLVYDLVRRGELHPVRVGKRLRFLPADVRQYLQRQAAEFAGMTHISSSVEAELTRLKDSGGDELPPAA